MTDSERLQIIADAYKKAGDVYSEVIVTPEGYEALLNAIKVLKWKESMQKEYTCRWKAHP